MLYLIGTGIAFDLTLSALDTLKSCDEVYIERYTNPILQEKITRLEGLIKKKVTVLERDKVESSYLVELGREKKVALLASGDPLTATTHITLIMEAHEKGVETGVIHNSSIYSAAPGKAGLQIYRFGKTATLVNPRPGYKPTSSLEVIRKNLSMDMHSLVLLDTEPEPMSAEMALQMLSGFDHAIVLSRVGEHDEKITYGRISDLRKMDLGTVPFTMIIPAKLHIVEEEFLSSLK